MNKKKLISTCLVFALSIIAIMAAIFIWSAIPNTETFSPKEGGMLGGAVMLLILGFTGIICVIAILCSPEN